MEFSAAPAAVGVDGMTSGGGGTAENGANTSGGSNEAADGAHQIDSQHPQDASAASVVSSPYTGGMQPQQPGGRAAGGGGNGAGAAAGYFQANGGSEAVNTATSTASSYPASYGNRALSQVSNECTLFRYLNAQIIIRGFDY